MTRTGRSAVVGRHAELAEIVRFLDSGGESGPRLLLLSGPAGIGKSALWRAGLDAARSAGYRVVSAQPTEVETGLPFAALGDLLGPLLGDVDPPLPEPQRDSLGAALLRASATASHHPLGVSLATLHVLRAASAAAPLLVAIDDAPWLDDASARALEFAIRRVDDEPLRFLLARRAASPDEPLPRWLEESAGERLRRLDVGPLTIDETGALLRRQLDLPLTRPILVRLHEISGGTPFYALELGRDPRLREPGATLDALEVPRSLDRLIASRLEALDPDTREITLAAAALGQPTVRTLELAFGRERVAAGLAAARAAAVLDVAGEDVRFDHPLLSAAAYGRASASDRRRVHERLAAVVAEPEERARHVARTTERPDATVARALEAGSAAAIRRGATNLGAELAEEAARLTPLDAPADRTRRRLMAAEQLIVAGDMHRADAILRELADDLAEDPAEEPLRAEILTRRALVALYDSDLLRAEGLLRDAMPLTAGDPRRRVTVHALLAGIGHLSWRGWRHARRDMWEALRLADEIADGPLELQMLGHAATWQFGLGRPWRDLIVRADELAVPLSAVPPLEHPDLQFARLLAREGDVDAGRARLDRLIEIARAAGDWTSLPRLLVSRAGIELEGGNLALAEQIVGDAQNGLLQTGEGAFSTDARILSLTIAAVRGDADVARRMATALEAEGRRSPQPLIRTGSGLALAGLELSLRNAAAALEQIGPVAAESGLGRLLPVRWETIVAIETEALVGVGRVAEARLRIEPVVRRARRRGPPAALAEALRASALVRAADGDHSAAGAADEAIAILSRLQLPFRSARAWLTLGEIRRRSRQKAAARVAFRAALELFTDVGARVWAERASSELGRVASRRPEGSPLTETERRVAELAGAGHTNREIADALFMSVHTVEAHLTRIFRTLGVQSRTELARADLDRIGGS